MTSPVSHRHLVVTAEFDRLCGEGKRYAEKLAMAGLLVEYVEVRLDRRSRPAGDH